MTTRLAVALLGLGSLVIADTAQAGVLDEFARVIFGRPSARLVPEEIIPFEMTVRPRPRKRPLNAAASKPAPPAIKLDPATEPYWYLKDPTLRRGDIVVADSGVLVFRGRQAAAHDAQDFVSLEHSKLVPKALKQRVAAGVAGRASAADRSGRFAVETTAEARR